jgi:Rad3-related DNA helicase
MWSLFEEKDGKKTELKPKMFSNGKSQEDIVKEAVEEIKKGRKIIFIHGVCGSGKSAIALNIAKELGRASIVVPIKNLQKQYELDYMKKKYLLKHNGDKLKIFMISGRNNHICPYLKDNKESIIETRKTEKNANLFNIFERHENEIRFEESCDNSFLPCKIEIKEKNLRTLKKYYKENPEHEQQKEIDLKTAKRLAVAPACSYWSPILPSDMKIKIKAQKREYESVSGKRSLYTRKEGCPYYSQFKSYLDSDVIIFNSHHYLLETALGRKPLTDVEIIDECDEFLDNFAIEGNINLNRLRNELVMFNAEDYREKKIVDSIHDLVNELALDGISHDETEIIEVNKTKIAELIKSFVNNDIFEMNDDSYLETCVETCRKFYEVLDDSYACFYKDTKKNEINIRLVTIHLSKMLNSIIEKNKAFVFMSGTLHSERVLKDIFGLKDFKIIDAETFNQGTIEKLRTGLEKDFRFDNFTKNRVSREDYLKALDKCVAASKLPTVVHVSAFADMPYRHEIDEFKISNLIASEQLIEMQKSDKEGKLVLDFKEGRTKVLFTTRCSRGIDFPFETCNSTIITKFPYPNTQSLFWRILKKHKPDIFWEFYKDKAHRELLQRVYRSVRDPKDHVYLLSPDSRVLDSNIFR